jgi:hypothetical protein
VHTQTTAELVAKPDWNNAASLYDENTVQVVADRRQAAAHAAHHRSLACAERQRLDLVMDGHCEALSSAGQFPTSCWVNDG